MIPIARRTGGTAITGGTGIITGGTATNGIRGTTGTGVGTIGITGGAGPGSGKHLASVAASDQCPELDRAVI